VYEREGGREGRREGEGDDDGEGLEGKLAMGNTYTMTAICVRTDVEVIQVTIW
jgi:hypothetical protein